MMGKLHSPDVSRLALPPLALVSQMCDDVTCAFVRKGSFHCLSPQTIIHEATRRITKMKSILGVSSCGFVDEIFISFRASLATGEITFHHSY